MRTVGSICFKRQAAGRMAGMGLIVVLLLAVAGCAANYGSFTLDAGVARDFEAGVIRPDYQYYYAGRDDIPHAIIAIDRRYSVPSRYWIAFEPKPEQLRDMSGNVYGKNRHDPYGALIRAADGEVVGIWYSNVRFRSVTVDQKARTVEILFSNPENDGGMGDALNIG